MDIEENPNFEGFGESIKNVIRILKESLGSK